MGRALGEGRPVRARRTTVPLDRRDHRTPKRIQSVVVFYPTYDDQQVVFPIDVDDVLAVADEVHAGRGRGVERLAVGVQLPARETDIGRGRSGSGGEGDPFFQDHFTTRSFADLQEKLTEAREVPRADEHAAAEVAAADGLIGSAVGLDPGVFLAVPAPRGRRPDWFH